MRGLKSGAAIDVFVFPHIGCFGKEKESATTTNNEGPCLVIAVHVGNNGVRRIYHLLKERFGTCIMMKKHITRLLGKRGRHGCTIYTDVLFQIFRHGENEMRSYYDLFKRLLFICVGSRTPPLAFTVGLVSPATTIAGGI